MHDDPWEKQSSLGVSQRLHSKLDYTTMIAAWFYTTSYSVHTLEVHVGQQL